MLDIIIAWVEGLVKVIETAPLQLWAVVLGFLTSWGFTQRAKFFIPKQLAPRIKSIIAQSIAFLIGFGTTWALWPDKYGFIMAFVVACFSPFSYGLMMNMMAKKFPATRRVLSLDYEDGTHEPKLRNARQRKKIIVAKVEVVPATKENT